MANAGANDIPYLKLIKYEIPNQVGNDSFVMFIVILTHIIKSIIKKIRALIKGLFYIIKGDRGYFTLLDESNHLLFKYKRLFCPLRQYFKITSKVECLFIPNLF